MGIKQTVNIFRLEIRRMHPIWQRSSFPLTKERRLIPLKYQSIREVVWLPGPLGLNPCKDNTGVGYFCVPRYPGIMSHSSL